MTVISSVYKDDDVKCHTEPAPIRLLLLSFYFCAVSHLLMDHTLLFVLFGIFFPHLSLHFSSSLSFYFRHIWCRFLLGFLFFFFSVHVNTSRCRNRRITILSVFTPTFKPQNTWETGSRPEEDETMKTTFLFLLEIAHVHADSSRWCRLPADTHRSVKTRENGTDHHLIFICR